MLLQQDIVRVPCSHFFAKESDNMSNCCDQDGVLEKVEENLARELLQGDIRGEARES